MGCAPSSPRGSRLRRSERDLRRFLPYNESVRFQDEPMNPRKANVSTFLFLLHVHAPRVFSSHAHGAASATVALTCAVFFGDSPVD